MVGGASMFTDTVSNRSGKDAPLANPSGETLGWVQVIFWAFT